MTFTTIALLFWMNQIHEKMPTWVLIATAMDFVAVYPKFTAGVIAAVVDLYHIFY